MASRETNKIGELLLGLVDKDARILDVGSGFGDKIEILKNLGFTNITGVEKNLALVDIARDKKMNVISSDEFNFESANEAYDVVIMSHIIEHFQYQDLIVFLENYLMCLKQGGVFLAASPVMNDSFYDDFDHVKPYSHVALLSMFGGSVTQVQYHSKINIELVDLSYFRVAYKLKNYKAVAMRTRLYRFPGIINQLLHLVHRISFRLIGEPKAWIGVFRKKK